MPKPRLVSRPVPPPPPVADKPREFFIHGVTSNGRPFRPSDWAERLCGVMSCYRPGGIARGRDAYIGYSPYVRPTIIGGVKCVVVDERLRQIERMAFDFVMNFARDNDLAVVEACSVEPGVAGSAPAGPAQALEGKAATAADGVNEAPRLPPVGLTPSP